MQQNRMFPRFSATKTSDLAAYVLSCRIPLKLETLSYGGCGFTGFRKDSKFNPGQEVSCVFSLPEGGWQAVSGKLLYAKPFSVGNQFKIYYGIEFSKMERELIAPILHQVRSAKPSLTSL